MYLKLILTAGSGDPPILGRLLGTSEGRSLGILLGKSEGVPLGRLLGSSEGRSLRRLLGGREGKSLGKALACLPSIVSPCSKSNSWIESSDFTIKGGLPDVGC